MVGVNKQHEEGALGDAEIVLITFTTTAELRRYIERNDITTPVLLDPDRTSYRAYGIGSATTRRVWGWRTLRRYLEILTGPERQALRRPTEDTRQLGADMVIDRNGDLSWARWSEGPDDRPSVEELIAAVCACG